MSGITGQRHVGTYETMRDGIQGEDSKGGKIVRGDNTGGVGLHEGISENFGITGGERRRSERSQGSENVFEALCTKLGGTNQARELAQLIFNDIGRERKRDLGQEFKVSDFQRIDERLERLQVNINQVSLNWQSQVSVPDSLKTSTVTWTEMGDVPDSTQGGYGDHNEYFKRGEVERSRKDVPSNIDQAIRARVKERLEAESNGGPLFLTGPQLRRIVDEEMRRFIG